MAEGQTYTSTLGYGGSSGGTSLIGQPNTSMLGVPFGGSRSESTPASITSAQTDWGLMQSTLLAALGDRTYNWALDQYAKGEGVTDQTIANFLEMSGKGKGLADTLLSQYQDQIKPLIDQYIREAGTYASDERQAFEAGKAMSTVGQANAAAMSEIERKLEGQGINVNSGRIQEQMIAARTQDAAARAGAGTKAAQDTEAIGRQMLEKSIAMGQQMPGQAMGAIQTAYAGLTGAENAILGLINSGKNLVDAAAPYYNASVGANKIPPVGQTSQSASQQFPPQGGGGASGGGGGSKAPGGGGSGGGQGRQPQQRQPQQPKGGEPKPKFDDRGKPATPYREPPPTGAGAPRKMPGQPQEFPTPVEAGTGAPEEIGETGPTYASPEGIITPEFSPGMGRDEAGNLYTPETAPWESAPQVSNWTLPDSYNQTYNAGQYNAPLPEGGAGGFYQREDGSYGYGMPNPDLLPFGMNNASATADPWGGGQTSSGGVDEAGFDVDYDRYAGNDFRQYASRSDIASDATGSIPYEQDFSNFDAFDRGYGNYDQYGGQNFDNYNAGEDFNSWYDQQNTSGGADENVGFGSYEDTWGNADENVGFGNYEDTWGDTDETAGFGSYEGTWGDTDENVGFGSYEDTWGDYGGGYDDYSGGYDDYSYDTSSYDDSYYDPYYGGGGYDDYDYSDYDDDYYYGGEDSSYAYAQGGGVRPRPMQRPPSRGQRPLPKPNGALSQQPRLRRPAQGGVMPTTGGAVPRSASPSQGRQTDDIAARLNAGEYVIPRDVVKHQGTKFFSDLIAKSRKLRTGMAGEKPKPTLKPAIPNARPTFQSRPLPSR